MLAADQRHGLNPGHDERHSPRRCIAALSPTAALQSVPGTSAARRRVKPWTQPAGSAARRHPGSNPREPTRRSSEVATISPSAATQRNPETPKDKASASQGRQGQGNDGRTCLLPRFRPFSVRPPRVPAGRDGTERTAGNRHQGNVRDNDQGTPQPTVISTQAAEPGSRCSRREPPGKPWRVTPTSGTDSTPATMKGTLPGAALPPCRRPQRGSQSRGRPPPGAGLSPGLTLRDQPQGVTPGSDRRELTRRSSGAATISPSATTQRNPKNAEGQGLSESRQAGTRERRPNVPTASISAFFGTSAESPRRTRRNGTHRRQPAPRQRPRQRPGNPAADGNFDPGSGTR